jgi:hypothetical protein
MFTLRSVRTRRVKCDEVHPRCLRCRKSGFKCEYDTVQAIAPGSTFIIYSADPLQLSPRDLPDANHHDLRAFDYFQSLTMLEIGGPWSAELYTNFLLPMSHHKNGIRQAVVALGAFHEGYVEAGGIINMDINCASQRYGLTQYSAAVRSVMELRVCHQSNAIDVALAACILFASIESLRGHTKTSLLHIYSGLRILEEEEPKGRSVVCGSIPRHLLRIVLQRLVGQVFEIGDRYFFPDFKASSDLQGIETGSLVDAIGQIEALQWHLHHLFHQQTLRLANMSKTGGLHATIALGFGRFKTRLEQIKVKYRNFLLSTRGCSRENCEDRTLLLFNVMVTNLEIIFNIDRTMSELASDTLIRKFREHVDWCEMYIRTFSKSRDATNSSETSTNTTGTPIDGSVGSTMTQDGRIDEGLRSILPKPPIPVVPSFSTNSGVVPSLYMTAARCRDPAIRREALKLLRTCDRREGLWDSNVAADIAGKIIDIEESPRFER